VFHYWPLLLAKLNSVLVLAFRPLSLLFCQGAFLGTRMVLEGLTIGRDNSSLQPVCSPTYILYHAYVILKALKICS
jgi:hypothetical protein